MTRTYGAALVSAVVVGGSLSGLGVYLGFPAAPSVGFGVICGLLAGLLLIGASRRADTFHPTDPNAHLADHSDVAKRPASDDDNDNDDPPAGAARG